MAKSHEGPVSNPEVEAGGNSEDLGGFGKKIKRKSEIVKKDNQPEETVADGGYDEVVDSSEAAEASAPKGYEFKPVDKEAIQYFKDNPSEIDGIMQDMLSLRGTDEGLPADGAHLAEYIKNNPDVLPDMLDEYQALSEAETLKSDSHALDDMLTDLIRLRGGDEHVKAGTWNREQMAYLGEDGLPLDYSHLKGYLKRNPDGIKAVFEEYRDLKAAEEFIADPKKVSPMVDELVKLRGGDEYIKEHGKFDATGTMAYLGEDGKPIDYSHLTGYLKRNPREIRRYLRERDQLRESADRADLDAKLEEISQRGDDYDPRNDFSGEQNIGVTGKQRIAGNKFDFMPHQKGETSSEYGARLRWQNEVVRFMGDNPQFEGESGKDYENRLRSLGMPSLEEFMARGAEGDSVESATEEASVEETEVASAEETETTEPDHRRLTRDELRDIIRRYPRNEGENTFDYAQRIYNETGIQIGNHINKGGETSSTESETDTSAETSTEASAEAEDNSAEEQEKQRKEVIDQIFSSDEMRDAASKAGYDTIKSLKKAPFAKLMDFFKKLVGKGESTDTGAGATESGEHRRLSRSELRDIVRRYPRNEGESTFDYAQRIYDTTGIEIGKHIRKNTGDSAGESSTETGGDSGAAGGETAGGDSGTSGSETAGDSAEPTVSRVESMGFTGNESWMGNISMSEADLADQLSKIRNRDPIRGNELEMQVAQDIRDVVNRWNTVYTPAQKQAIMAGDFTSFDVDATIALHDRDMAIKYNLLSDVPPIRVEDYLFAEDANEYDEMSKAATGLYESEFTSGEGDEAEAFISKVEFTDDEIWTLVGGDSEAASNLSDLIEYWNGLSEDQRRAVVSGRGYSNRDRNNPDLSLAIDTFNMLNYGPAGALIGRKEDVEFTRMRALNTLAAERRADKEAMASA